MSECPKFLRSAVSVSWWRRLMIICQILFIDIRFTYIFSVYSISLPDTALPIKGFMLDESEQLEYIYLECPQG